MTQYAPCPRCAAARAKPVMFTWWGGLLGPKLFTHVRCEGCGVAYNGKTGRSNTTAIVIYSVVGGMVAIVIGAALLWMWVFNGP
ncbi:MAG: hypothetical protein QM783_13575 [Phycisphaerales bacterium]